MVPLYCVVNASSPAMGVPLPRPLWVSAIIVGAPMHYGNFAGMWMRLVYLFLAIGSSALSLSGFAMYAMKARRTRAKGAAQ